MANRNLIATYLSNRGKALLREPRTEIRFTDTEEVNHVLNDIERYPHLYVLGCLMDKGVGRKKAWEIPDRLREKFNLPGYDFEQFQKLSRDQVEKAFIQDTLHRYPSKMARIFSLAVEHIAGEYDGDAGRIWGDRPHSAALVRRLLGFDGMGMKNALIAANDLYRDFKVALADQANLDITPDAHVRRVFQRVGFINRHSSAEELMYCARDMNPRYPGVFDKPAFDLGTSVCRSGEPECRRCELNRYCPKNL